LISDVFQSLERLSGGHPSRRRASRDMSAPISQRRRTGPSGGPWIKKYGCGSTSPRRSSTPHGGDRIPQSLPPQALAQDVWGCTTRTHKAVDEGAGLGVRKSYFERWLVRIIPACASEPIGPPPGPRIRHLRRQRAPARWLLRILLNLHRPPRGGWSRQQERDAQNTEPHAAQPLIHMTFCPDNGAAGKRCPGGASVLTRWFAGAQRRQRVPLTRRPVRRSRSDRRT
jgi:hypothetical protein